MTSPTRSSSNGWRRRRTQSGRALTAGGPRGRLAAGVGLLTLLAGCQPDDTAPAAQPGPVLDYVNPFVATGGPGFRVGSSTPAATMPFGLVKVGPDTSLE